MNDDKDDYAEWLKHRRAVHQIDGLTDRIMSKLTEPTKIPPSTTSPPSRLLGRVGPGLLLTAASLLFAAKIVALIGNLVFPTESFPEFANDPKVEEPADAHGNI